MCIIRNIDTQNIEQKSLNVVVKVVKMKKVLVKKIPVYQKLITRTKCKAKLRITREKWGEWKVGKFVMEHNHKMVATDQTHLLRFSRNISHAQKSTLEAMMNARISVANVVSYKENEAQGPQNLRFIRKDTYDHLNRLRKHTKVENGYAFALVHYFMNKSNKEPFFYWNVQLDDDNKVMNFFFRDYRCRVDYEYFGDVLLVDTTYRINNYNLICKNVTFDLAFMSDETESSFEWLFRIFLNSMSGKQPETIFTGQCQAMMNAVEIIFLCAHHCLCKAHKETRNMLTEILHSASQQMNALFENLSLDDQNICDDLVVDEVNDRTDEVLIRNPCNVKSRGITNAHIVCHWDDNTKKEKEKKREKLKVQVFDLAKIPNYVDIEKANDKDKTNAMSSSIGGSEG
ncbi:hypothetical protein Pfo_003449 [Paulownia fortunei]|nr:hypothetical protein Pfo_003449 [Paulownia fortunei]